MVVIHFRKVIELPCGPKKYKNQDFIPNYDIIYAMFLFVMM